MCTLLGKPILVAIFVSLCLPMLGCDRGGRAESAPPEGAGSSRVEEAGNEPAKGCGPREPNERSEDEYIEMLNNPMSRDYTRGLRGLRRVGTDKSVPRLFQILHVGANMMSAHLAAEALFCIGTEKATRALDDHFRSDNKVLLKNLALADSPRLPPEKLRAFVERYYGAVTGRGVELKLGGTESVKQGRQHFSFSFEITNRGAEPWAMFHPNRPLGESLTITDTEGRTVSTRVTARVNPAGPDFDPLPPGKTVVHRFETEVESRARREGEGEGGDLLVLVGDINRFQLKAPGRFQVWARYGWFREDPVTRSTPDGVPQTGGFPIWTGLIVSNPVSIEVRPVSSQ